MIAQLALAATLALNPPPPVDPGRTDVGPPVTARQWTSCADPSAVVAVRNLSPIGRRVTWTVDGGPPAGFGIAPGHTRQVSVTQSAGAPVVVRVWRGRATRPARLIGRTVFVCPGSPS